LKLRRSGGHIVGEGGFQEQRADEIIGDSVHPQLAFDHLGSAAAQDVERKVGLDLAIMEFDLPAAGIEFGDGRVGKGLFVGQ